MPFSTYTRNKWLDVLRGGGVGVTFTAPAAIYASLHTAAPGDTGANEVTGGSPAYARKATVFGAASAGSATGDAPVFDVPAGITVTHVGYWDAPTAGNFIAWDDVTPEAFASQGTGNVTPQTRSLT